jgi:O-antigen ligase
MYLLILIPIIFRQILIKFREKDRKTGRNYTILLCLAAFALLITQNRGSWVGLAIGMPLTIILDLFSNGTKKVRRVMIRIIATLLIFSLYPVARYGPRMYERMFVGKNAVSNKAESRATYDVDAWKQFHLHPVFGCGVSNVRYYSRIIFTHNLYLLMLSETGVVGFIFFILYLIGHLKVSLKARKARDVYVANMGIGLLASLLSLFIASVPGPDYGITPQVSSHLWIVTAILLSLTAINSKAMIQMKYQKRKEFFQEQIAKKAMTPDTKTQMLLNGVK